MRVRYADENKVVISSARRIIYERRAKDSVGKNGKARRNTYERN